MWYPRTRNTYPKKFKYRRDLDFIGESVVQPLGSTEVHWFGQGRGGLEYWETVGDRGECRRGNGHTVGVWVPAGAKDLQSSWGHARKMGGFAGGMTVHCVTIQDGCSYMQTVRTCSGSPGCGSFMQEGGDLASMLKECTNVIDRLRPPGHRGTFL